MERSIQSMLDELDDNYVVQRQYDDLEQQKNTVVEEYKKKMMETYDYSFYKNAYITINTSDFYEKVEVSSSYMFNNTERRASKRAKIFCLLVILGYGLYIMNAFDFHGFFKIMLFLIGSAIILGLGKGLKELYLVLPFAQAKIRTEEKVKEEIVNELFNIIEDGRLQVIAPFEEKLKRLYASLTIPPQYAGSYNKLQRMKDNIETGRAKSIKEAVLLMDDYAQRERLIETNLESARASRDAAYAAEMAAEAAYEAAAEIADSNAMANEYYEDALQSNEKLYDKLDDISFNTDPRWK